MTRISTVARRRAAVLGLILLLSSCASRQGAGPLATAPIAPAVTVRPQPPGSASTNVVVPPVGPDGRYRTINSGLSPAATIWHVRSALNVAALGCRGTGEVALIADYNAMLSTKKAVLASAFRSTETETRSRGGKDWRDVHDRTMTSVYNFFAQPPAKVGFCRTAAIVAAEAAVQPAAGFEAFSAAALPRLEAPFIEFYRLYDDYRRDLAAWEANGRAVMGPAAVSPPVVTAAVIPPVVAASVQAAQPARLAYAPIETVISWEPEQGGRDRMAAR